MTEAFSCEVQPNRWVQDPDQYQWATLRYLPDGGTEEQDGTGTLCECVAACCAAEPRVPCDVAQWSDNLPPVHNWYVHTVWEGAP